MVIRYIHILIGKAGQCISVLNKIYILLENVRNKEIPPHTHGEEPTAVSLSISLFDVGGDEELMTIDDACAMLHISRATLRKLRLRGLLSDVKLGSKNVRFRTLDVKKLYRWYSIPKGKG